METIGRYRPLIIRSILYAIISGLTVWTTAIGDKGGEDLWKVIEDRWLALSLLSLLAVATTLRAQFDGTIARIPKKPGQPENPPIPR
jgi:hypothetical protein